MAGFSVGKEALEGAKVASAMLTALDAPIMFERGAILFKHDCSTATTYLAHTGIYTSKETGQRGAGGCTMSMVSIPRLIHALPSWTGASLEVHGWRYLSVIGGSETALTSSSRRHAADDSLLPQVNVLLTLVSIIRLSADRIELRKVTLSQVTIIGRPNVGKSALFNKLLRKTAALVCWIAGFGIN